MIYLFFYGDLFKVHSFHIFYGHPNEAIVAKLATKDAAIVEPTAFTKEQTSNLQEEGVRLFGYVSLMQLENWNEKLKKKVIPSDYAKQNGNTIYIKEWDTYVMNISEKHYRDILLWKIKSEIATKELDGIFFDTVDDLDYYFRDDPVLQNKMRKGYSLLLDEIKQKYPELLIIQNRGFDSYKTVSRKKVDGLLWEGFSEKDIKSSEWAKNWLTYLKKEQRWGHVRVMTVVTDEASKKQSKKEKFPAFMRTGDTYQ